MVRRLYIEIFRKLFIGIGGSILIKGGFTLGKEALY